MKKHEIPDLNVDLKSFPFQLPLHALYSSREQYANYPPFQREEVWPDKFKKEYIEALVMGLYVPDILVVNMPGTSAKKWVLDGQQRLQTALQFMMAMEARDNGKPIPRDNNGKEYYYFLLPERQKERFKNRMIRFTELQHMSPEELLTKNFLGLNNQIGLTTAERLWASPSQICKVGALLCEHPYFETIYGGKTGHKQPFQTAIYPVAIEMYQTFTDLSTDRLRTIARGNRDSLVYPGIENVIHRNLTAIIKLFHGVKTGAMTEIIILYQTVWLLNSIGADYEQTQEGALTEWYKNIQATNLKWKSDGFMNLFAQLPRTKFQIQQWKQWLPEIVYSGKIIFTDKQEAHAQTERILSWLTHDGICPTCHYIHVQLADIKQHGFHYPDTLNPSLNTCATHAKTARQPVTV